MTTDSERREVARRLREIELMRLPDSDSEMEAIHEAVGCWFGQPHFDQEVTDRHYMERCEIGIDNENESACITVYLGKTCS